jgi:hypothetical protein
MEREIRGNALSDDCQREQESSLSEPTQGDPILLPIPPKATTYGGLPEAVFRFVKQSLGIDEEWNARIAAEAGQG